MPPQPSDHDELRTTPIGASPEVVALHAEVHVALKGSVTVVSVERGATVTIGRASFCRRLPLLQTGEYLRPVKQEPCDSFRSIPA